MPISYYRAQPERVVRAAIWDKIPAMPPLPPAPAKSFGKPPGRRHIAALILGLFAAGCAGLPARAPAPHPLELQAARALWEGDAARSFYLFRHLANSHDPRLHGAAAAAARQAGMFEEALNERKAALDGAGTHRHWHRMWIARLLMRSGKLEEALSALDAPRDAWGKFTRGQILARLGRLEEAIEHFSAAAELDPTVPLFHQERAEVLEMLGKLSESRSAYDDTLDLDRSPAHIQMRIAGLETKIGEEDSAYRRLTRLLLVDSDHPKAKEEKEKLAESRPEFAAREEAEERDREYAWARLSSPRVSPMPPSPLAPIRVGIVTGLGEFRTKFAAEASIEFPDGSRELVPENIEIRGKMEGEGVSLHWDGKNREAAGAVRIGSRDPAATFMIFDVHFAKGFYWSDRETRTFRGDLQIIPGETALHLINVVSLEEYLLGVIPSEMPPSWPPEALRAQAVAARTETLRKLGRHRAQGFDICATQHCAVYRGVTGERESTTEACSATRGLVLKTASGGYLDTVFAANCGGWGSSAADIWGSANQELAAVCDLSPRASEDWTRVPYDPDVRERYIFSRMDAYCAHQPPSPKFRWTRCYTEKELGDWLDRRYGTGTLKGIRILDRTPEGWVTAIEVMGDKGDRTVRRDAIRGALNIIRSNYFTLEYLPAAGGMPAKYIFYGAGWGHGAGMCQDGACGLARRGKKFRAILSHYYPRARLVRLY